MNRLTRVSGPRWNERQEAGENSVRMGFTIYRDQIEDCGLHWAGSTREEIEVHRKFMLESLNGRENLENLGMDGRDILKWI